MRRAPLAIPALLAALTPARAEPPLYHCARPGTVAQYSFGIVVGSQIRLESAADTECTWRNLATQKTWTDHAFFVSVKPVADEGYGPDELRAVEEAWHLPPGESRDITVYRSGHRYRQSFTAIGPETVTVMAGTFATWHMRFTTQLSQSGITDLWWSPALGIAIQRKFHVEGGRWENTPEDSELVAVRTP